MQAIDRILRNDRIVASDNPVASDTTIKTDDPAVAGNDRTIISSDTPVAGYDRTIISDSDAAQQDAANDDSALHVGVGVSSYTKKESPTATSSQKRATALTPTVTEVWLRAQGVSKKKARQFRDFDAAATQHEWETEIPAKGSVPEGERQHLIGRLLDRWEVRPPTLPPPPASAQQNDDEAIQRNAAYRDAHWHAQELLGPGAAYQDMAIVVEALVAGATDAQALAALGAEHAVGAGLVPALQGAV
jgi:hypothetical protein